MMKVSGWRWWWRMLMGIGGCLALIHLVLMGVIGMWLPHTSPTFKAPHRINTSHYLDSLSALAVKPLAVTMRKAGLVRTVLVVPSSPGNIRARAAVREGWGSLIPSTWALVFFLGATRDATLQKQVINEAQKHQDIAQDISFVDSYANLTLKTLTIIHWVKKLCPRAEFVIKVDDDVYINIQKLCCLTECISRARKNIYGRLDLEGDLENKRVGFPFKKMEEKVLKSPLPDGSRKQVCPTKCSAKSKASEGSSHSLLCNQIKPYQYLSYFVDSHSHKYESYVFGGYLYRSVKPDRYPGSKWYLASDIYGSNFLPPFLSGTAYLLTSNLMPHLLNAARHTPIIPLEDVYLSGLVGSAKLKLKLSHIDGWWRFRPRWDDACIYSSLLTAHGLTPTELVDFTKATIQLSPKECDNCFAQAAVWMNSLVSSLIPRLPSTN